MKLKKILDNLVNELAGNKKLTEQLGENAKIITERIIIVKSIIDILVTDILWWKKAEKLEKIKTRITAILEKNNLWLENGIKNKAMNLLNWKYFEWANDIKKRAIEILEEREDELIDDFDGIIEWIFGSINKKVTKLLWYFKEWC